MIMYEKLAREILGQELFDDTISFFNEIFERSSEFKIILTRRCFSLFKIFREILKSDIGESYGHIITDNNVELYFNEIQKAIATMPKKGAAPVIIADDIVIFGRTVGNIIGSISDQIEEECAKQIRAISIARNSGSFFAKKYDHLMLTRHGVSPLEWKEISNKFSRLIKATDKPNTSYVISYRTLLGDVPREFFDFCQDRMYMLIQHKELDRLGVKPYVISASSQKGVFDFGNDLFGLIRVYIYNDIKSIQISPLIILNNMAEKKVDVILEKVADTFCNGNKAIKDLIAEKKLYKFKMRMLTLLLSHILLYDFLKKHGFDCESENKYDFDEIIPYNFSEVYLDSFKEFNKKLSQLKSPSELEYFIYDSDGIEYSQEFDDLVFKKAMEDNASARNESTRNNGFNTMNGVSLFSKKFSANLMMLLDSGRAALKIILDNDEYCSVIYSGEQAFRIMNDQFIEFLPSLHMLENMADLCNKKSYNLYRSFLQKVNSESKELLPDNQYCKFNEYIKILEDTEQQISDVMCVIFVEFDKLKEEQINKMLDAYVEDEFNGKH